MTVKINMHLWVVYKYTKLTDNLCDYQSVYFNRIDTFILKVLNNVYICDMEILTENPFTGSYKIKTIRTYYNQDNLRKLLETNTDSKAYYEYETTERITVFPNKDFMDLLLTQAKPITLKLYVFILNNCLRKDYDFIELKVKDVQAYLGVSRMNLYKGIDELRSFRFMAPRKGRNVYWLNTELAFSGDRIKYLYNTAPDAVKIVKTGTQYL